MKPEKIFLVLIILFASFQICFGQASPKAELIDRIERTSCEDITARLDNLFSQLINEPNSVGYAVIYGKKNDFSLNLSTEKILRGHRQARRFDESRFVIVRGKDRENIIIELWKAPMGAEKPNFEEAEWNFTLAKDKKPFIFNSDLWDISPCPIGSQMKIYSDFIKANPTARGHIVIFARTRRKFQKEKDVFLNELVSKYKIPSNQLRFFFVDKKTGYSYFEMWLVPKKKNK